MLYKEITDSGDDKKQTHNNQKNQIRHITESRRAVKSGGGKRSGEGGAGPGGGPQGRLAMPLSGGGPTVLGLLSLAFPLNIVTSLRTINQYVIRPITFSLLQSKIVKMCIPKFKEMY